MNKRHRIFIAINLPEHIKNNLAEYQEKWPELASAVRWTKKDNLHITLVFLGYVNDEELVDTCNLVKETARKHNSFLIKLNRICYGPPDKFPPRPPKFSEEVIINEQEKLFSQKLGRARMVWAIGEKSDDFAFLKDDLNKFLEISEKRSFSPHVTLGRLRQFEWRKIEPEQRPEINEDIDLTFEVESVEVMESVLRRGGPEYSVIESVPLCI